MQKKDFKCERCGECCLKYTVKLTHEDIRKIKKAGYKDFAERDDFDKKYGEYALKRPSDRCIFLEAHDGMWKCRIYDHRPKICREYPFLGIEEIPSCKPEVR